jgi:preprotein translocase SecE subunit
VTWPTWRELYSYTLVVIATVIIIGAFISGADLVVTSLLQHFVYNVH